MQKNNQAFPLCARSGGFAFMAMIALYVFISFFGQTICATLFPNGGAGYIAVCSTFSIISLLIIIVCFSAKNKGEKVLENLGVKKFKPSSLSLSIMLSVGMFLGLGFVNDAFVKLLEKLNLSVGGAFIPLENVSHLIVFTLMLAVLPAVFEEIFFRGLLLKSLSGVKTVTATIAIALCFALYHCSASQFIYQFIYGAGLTLLTIFSGSVIPAIIAHFINNFAVIIFEYFKVKINLYNPILVAVGLVILIAFFVIIILKLKNDKKENSEPVKNFFLPYGIFGALICLALLVSSLFVGA